MKIGGAFAVCIKSVYCIKGSNCSKATLPHRVGVSSIMERYRNQPQGDTETDLEQTLPTQSKAPDKG